MNFCCQSFINKFSFKNEFEIFLLLFSSYSDADEIEEVDFNKSYMEDETFNSGKLTYLVLFYGQILDFFVIFGILEF